MTERASDWKRHKDNYGSLDRALTNNYPETLKAEPQLQAALLALRNIELAIDGFMNKLAEAEDDDF